MSGKNFRVRIDDDANQEVPVELCLDGKPFAVVWTDDQGTADFILADDLLAGPHLLTANAGAWSGVLPIVSFVDDSEPTELLLSATVGSARFLLPSFLPDRGVTWPSTQIPTEPRYPGRVSPEDASRQPWLVAGGPLNSSLPVDRTGRRYETRFLEVIGSLKPNEWGSGVAHDFEVTWEPLGWALDEWIATECFAPGVERATTETTVAARSGAASSSLQDQQAHNQLSEGAQSSTNEVMSLAAASMSSSRYSQVGLGATNDRSTSLTIDPIFSLIRSVTGAIQVGHSNGRSEASSTSTGQIQQLVRSRIEQSTHNLMTSAQRALSESETELRDQRSMEIIRNTSDGKALNLALFGLSRQWLVTTAAAAKRNVVLVPIYRCSEPFEEPEVFHHRVIISEVLLDEGLRPALDRVANTYDPHPIENDDEEAPPSTSLIRHIKGRARFSDKAGGRNSHIELVLRFRGHPSDDEVAHSIFETAIGRDVEFTVPINRQLSDFVGLSLTFRNPGRVSDEYARIETLELTAIDHDDVPELLHRLDYFGLVANRTRTISTAARPTAEAANRRGRDTGRILHHLNAHVSYYRLALDLSRDPVTRFIETSSDASQLGMPSDMNPVGVAGAHIAYLADPESEADNKPVDECPPFQDLLSTPAGGVWREAMTGSHNIAVPDKKPESWSDLPRKDGSFAWPIPHDLTLAEAKYAAAQAAVGPDKPATVKPTVASLAESLAALQAGVDKLLASEAATAPDAPASLPPDGAPKDKTSGTGATKDS